MPDQICPVEQAHVLPVQDWSFGQAHMVPVQMSGEGQTHAAPSHDCPEGHTLAFTRVVAWPRARRMQATRARSESSATWAACPEK